MPEFLSTPSARRATLRRRGGGLHGRNFYPRPPRGGRPRVRGNLCVNIKFLSTPSARRATCAGRAPDPRLSGYVPISIHALREEGDIKIFTASSHYKISIHALREEGDHRYFARNDDGNGFLSTPSARRATLHNWVKCSNECISIHALREEGDQAKSTKAA